MASRANKSVAIKLANSKKVMKENRMDEIDRDMLDIAFTKLPAGPRVDIAPAAGERSAFGVRQRDPAAELVKCNMENSQLKSMLISAMNVIETNGLGHALGAKKLKTVRRKLSKRNKPMRRSSTKPMRRSSAKPMRRSSAKPMRRSSTKPMRSRH
jgi:hypothetical protein